MRADEGDSLFFSLEVEGEVVVEGLIGLDLICAIVHFRVPSRLFVSILYHEVSGLSRGLENFFL